MPERDPNVPDSIPCPSCHQPLMFSDRTTESGEQPACPHCSWSCDPAEFVEVVEEVAPTVESAQPTAQKSRRWLVAVVVFLVVSAVGVQAYRYARDHWKPGLKEAKWKQLRIGLTLPEVEALVSKGRPCDPQDVKAALEKAKVERRFKEGVPFAPMPPSSGMEAAKDALKRMREMTNMPFPSPMPPFDRNPFNERDTILDVAEQTIRQRVESWYRWESDETQLFAGLNAANQLCIYYLIRRLPDTVSISYLTTVDPLGGQAGPTGKSVEAKLADEKIVEEYIRKNATNPDAIEVIAWGPHDLRGDLITIPGYESQLSRKKRVGKVRVRFWEKKPDGAPQYNDRLYYIQSGGEVFGSSANPYGDKWIDVLRDLERRLYPGR